jgi:hypothetical protein
MKSMVIKHGLAVADIGKGELSSAMEGLNLVTGVVRRPVTMQIHASLVRPGKVKDSQE